MAARRRAAVPVKKKVLRDSSEPRRIRTGPYMGAEEREGKEGKRRKRGMASALLRYLRRRCQICRRLPMRYHHQHLWRCGGIRVLHAEDVNERGVGL
jgi:hypothetical protein